MSLAPTPSAPPALISTVQSPATRPPTELAGWLDTLGNAGVGKRLPPSLPTADGDMQLASSPKGKGSQVPAITLNPALQNIAGRPIGPEGRYTGKSVEAVPQVATEDELAQAFAQQFKVAGTRVGILGEGHSTDAFDILEKAALATQRAVAPSGRQVIVALESATNPAIDKATDQFNKGSLSSKEFLKVVSENLGGSNPGNVALIRQKLEESVVPGHESGLKYVFWDKARSPKDGHDVVNGNRDSAGADFLAQQVRKNPDEVIVVEAGLAHAQLNPALVSTRPTPGVTDKVTLANLLVGELGRKAVFTVGEDPVVVTAAPMGGKERAVHQFPDHIDGFRHDSPVTVPGVNSEGQPAGARYPTYDAIVPVIIPRQ